MIIYSDTSALVKLFVAEDSSYATRKVLGQAQALGTALLTRAELGAALARGARRGIISEGDSLEARDKLAAVWPTWVHITVDQALVLQAETLVWEHALRGYDAVHLAAALVWQNKIASPVTMATFDQELWEAANRVGLGVWPERSAPS